MFTPRHRHDLLRFMRRTPVRLLVPVIPALGLGITIFSWLLLPAASSGTASAQIVVPSVKHEPPDSQKNSPPKGRTKEEGPPAEYLPRPSPAEQKTLDALQKPISVEIENTPLAEAIREVARKAGAQIVVDNVALEQEGILATEELVTLAVDEIRMESVLRLILEPLGLTFLIENEVLKVTTELVAENTFFTRTYSVQDLGDRPEDFGELIETVMETVDHHWLEVDGVGGTISAVNAARSLVIKQTHAAHADVLQLLRDLRTHSGRDGAADFPD